MESKPKLLIVDSDSESESESTNNLSSINISESSNTKSSNKSSNSKNENETKESCEKTPYSKKCNSIKLKKEIIDKKKSLEDTNSNLYPILDDVNFNLKIKNKQEFNECKLEDEIHSDIEKYTNKLVNAPFELAPHQNFVKNFMSFETPYNSLLLFHELGTGKTCSAIGVCEEMRLYLKQINLSKRIIIVANENVQDNFRKELFDENKLKLINGKWNLHSCIGNTLLKEINPSDKELEKEKMISLVKNLINMHYVFFGYEQFANYIGRTILNDKSVALKDHKDVEITDKHIQRLQKEFNNRLIVIDEVHNIRKSTSKDKKISKQLENLVKHTLNIRLLLLSATPMFDNYKEIIWLINLLNMNDKRATISLKDVFNNDGTFTKDGKELLEHKITGYVSYVKGENPYTFPYRVYPNEFDESKTLKKYKYPEYQMNLNKIPEEDRKQIFSLYLNKLENCSGCGLCQYCNYKYSLDFLRNKNFNIERKDRTISLPSFDKMESFGYTTLSNPVENLIISYPYDKLKDYYDFSKETKYTEIIDNTNNNGNNESQTQSPNTIKDSNVNHEKKKEFHIKPNELTGKHGISRIMNYTETNTPYVKGSYEYKKNTIKTYGKIFNRTNIKKYSIKIHSILNSIYNIEKNSVSEGIVLIYSQYLDSGLIPMALALEEMGFIRYGKNTNSLFKTKPCDTVDSRTMKPKNKGEDFKAAKYILITGDKRLSPANDYEVKKATSIDNKEGHNVKVILISKTGSEGIDFKYIRQVHILEPWYNINRIEQIIGRGVRNLSHKDLPFSKRNVEIYLHGTIIGDENIEESADLYIYRSAQSKAINIGKITRLLKENSVDCYINIAQNNYTNEVLSNHIKNVKQILSSGVVINDFKIGSRSFSNTCDYMDKCLYKCKNENKIDEINNDTYSETYIKVNTDQINEKIKKIFKNDFFFKKNELIKKIQSHKVYPLSQIYYTLTKILEDESEYIEDKFNRRGRLLNIGDYYIYQPYELTEEQTSIFEISTPFKFKQKHVLIDQLKQDELTSETRETHHFTEGKNILDEMQKNITTVNEYELESNVTRGDDNWYKYCGIVVKKLKQMFPEIPNIYSFIAEHMIDVLTYKEKVSLLNYIYNIENINDTNSLSYLVRNYFEKIKITNESLVGIILYDNKTKHVLHYNNNKWQDTEPEDERILLQSKDLKNKQLEKKDVNKLIGFIAYENTNKLLVFKTKYTNVSRNTGVRCEESSKSKSMKIFNDIVGNEMLTKENTKLIKKKNEITQHPISNTEICVMQELILRYFNSNKKNNLRWFFSPDEIFLYNI